MVQKYTFIEGSLDELVAQFSDNDTFALDLETTGLNPLDSRLLLCQIGFRTSGTYVIDVSKVRLDPLIPYFTNRKWRKIIQNSKFERKFIRNNLGVRINNVFDTFLAEKLLTTDDKYVSASLEALALKYAGVQLNKKIRKGFESHGIGAFSEAELDYAADDVIVLFPIMDGQIEALEKINSTHIAELEFEVAQMTSDMESAGVPVFVDKWKANLKETEREHEESRLRMHEILFDENSVLNEQMGMFARDGIKLNSVPQVKTAFQKIGINIESTNERELSLIDHPAAKELLRYRGFQKTLSSYGETFLGAIHPFDQRIHADWLQLGTDTGRYSCKDPNMQQIPDRFRQCIGHPDYRIIAADYSQMELRILAELSQDPNFVQAFLSGQDLHKSTAATMFGIPIENVTKEQRFIAKTINFGLAYGMGTNKLMDTLNAEAQEQGTKKYTLMQCRNLISKYKTAYQTAVWWLDDAGSLAMRRGYSETMYGRRRYFKRPVQGIAVEAFDAQVGSIRRQGANSPIQGTNADITKLAMIEIQNEFENYGFSANIILQVHDEIVALARKEEAEAVRSVLVDAMVAAGEKVMKTIPVKVEAYISDVWKKG